MFSVLSIVVGVLSFPVDIVCVDDGFVVDKCILFCVVLCATIVHSYMHIRMNISDS